jgi:phosphotransferase system HPr-like phosphotransfer protein
LALLVYQQESTSRSVLVLVTEPPAQDGQESDDLVTSTLTVTELESFTSTNDIEFERAQGTSSEDTSVLYVAATQLPGGNILAIFIDAPADDAALPDLLATILNSVQLTGS